MCYARNILNKQHLFTLRNKHNAVESNINDLTYCGLNLCMDKGEAHYKRYTALGVLTYNIKKLGQLMIKQERGSPKYRKAA